MNADAAVEVLQEIKQAYAGPDGGRGGASALAAAARLIAGADAPFLRAVQGDRDAALALLRMLAGVGDSAAVAGLLSTLDIARDDRQLLEAAVGDALGGAPRTTHQWMTEYDVAAQRMEMIRTCVLPFAQATPGKQLFAALKRYEYRAIAANTPVLDAEALHAALAAARAAGAADAAVADAVAAREGAPVRILMPNAVFNVALRLAWQAPQFLLELHERHAPAALVEALAGLDKVVPVYLMPTHLGYPMGGGESFMHQTCRVLSEFGVRCVWVSYLDPVHGWYTADSVTYTPYYLDVRRAGGCSEEAIQREVDYFGPDLIHAQGGTNEAAMAVATRSRIQAMIGYHFWSGLVQLGETGNRHIMDNLSAHALTPPPPPSRTIWKYVASEFMQQVHQALGGKESLNVIHAVSDRAQYYTAPAPDARFVLQINVCPLKGGEIFLACVKALGETVPFMGIKSEVDGTGFFDILDAEVAAYPLSQLKSYGNVRDFYRMARMVIVPTLVDETFCRVAFEAAMNGIPVISTRNGFLPLMLGESGMFRGEDADEWIATIGELYHNTERLARIGAAQKAHLETHFGSEFRSFIAPAMHLIDHAPTRSIGIFTVWGDLGLGNLCLAYARLLRSAGYRVHIFSFQPYSSNGKSLVRQSAPGDWSAPEHADSVHYSFNCREEVTPYELTQFILSNQIHTLLVPEVCWNVNWNRLFALQIPKLDVCVIPMIEIVIEEEIAHHNRVAATLFCTRLAERVLVERGVHNGAFLGHGFGRPLPPERVAQKRDRLARRDKIRFLHVAGHNPTSRKNTPQILEAFSRALVQRGDIELTVTSMDPLASYYQGQLPPGITIVDRSIGHGELLDLYEEFDVSIQVSSHEGLGLGFYESTSRATPVLSLDGAPHNEVVREGLTGWLIPATAMPVPDNARSVVPAWRFNTDDLTARIVALEREDVLRTISSTADVFRSSLDEIALLCRFIAVLPVHGRGEAPAPAAAPELIPAALAPAPAPEPAAPPAPAGGVKLALKRAAYLGLRTLYRAARPVTSRVAFRLRLIVEAPVAALRHEVNARMDLEQAQGRETLELTRQLLGEVRVLADRQRAQGLAQQAQGLALNAQPHAQYQQLAQQLAALRRETRHIKERMATYAGEGAVLTYLRDEHPIFVNTGDLGCPSPIINGGVWEPDNLDVLFSFVKDDTVFLDIGANVGYFALALGNRVGRAGQVHAFEPHPVLVNLIERSVHLNGLERVVQVHQCALSDTDGQLDLYYPAGHLGKGSHLRNADEPGTHVVVPSHALDHLLPELVVDLVKIDVEGHELAVLKGMRAMLTRSPDVKLLFEKLEPDNADTRAIAALLDELGLHCYGVGPAATLVPLAGPALADWIGDILATRDATLGHARRNGFAIYPGQLMGQSAAHGDGVRFSRPEGGIAFFGPDWYLPAGKWRLRLDGALSGGLRLVLADADLTLAELRFDAGHLEGEFFLDSGAPHFEVRAFADKGSVIDLVRLELQRV